MGLFQVMFFGVFALIIFMWIYTYIKNENSPIISTQAQLVEKNRNTHTHTDANGFITTDETLTLKFKLDTGSEVKFVVGRRIFQEIQEYEWGKLTFQGTRFLKFQWENGYTEK